MWAKLTHASHVLGIAVPDTLTPPGLATGNKCRFLALQLALSSGSKKGSASRSPARASHHPPSVLMKGRRRYLHADGCYNAKLSQREPWAAHDPAVWMLGYSCLAIMQLFSKT